MSSKSIFLFFALVSVVPSFVACSKSPKAYDTKAPTPAPVVLEKAVPTDQQYEKALVIEVNGEKVSAKDLLEMPISTEDAEGGFAYDAKIKATSSLPILYGKGAGGITFDTTLDEVEEKKLLSRASYGPDVNGNALYYEGLWIVWREETPRTPIFIQTQQDYLGEIPMPTPLQPIKMGFDFGRLGYKVDTLEGAQEIAVDYYRIMEKTSETYNCLSENTCQVIWGNKSQKDFVFSISGKMSWLISKDRFVIYVSRLLDPKPTLAFDLNLLTGSLLMPNQAATPTPNVATIELGQTYADIEQKITDLIADPLVLQRVKTSVSYDSFSRSYNGTALAYQKTVFDRSALQPLASDKMNVIQVWSGYPNAITLGNRQVVVTETASGVELRASAVGEITSFQETVDRREQPLKISLGLNPKNVRSFVEKLKDLIAAEMKTTYPSAVVVTRFIGAFQRPEIKEYTANIIVYDKTANDGLFIQFGAEEEQGNLTSFIMIKLGGEFNALDPLIFGEIASPIEKVTGVVPAISAVTGKELKNPDGSPVMVPGKLATFTELSGVAIGDQVNVTDWDLGRSEATIAFQKAGQRDRDPVFVYPKVRAGYSDRATIDVSFSPEKEMPQDVAYANFGSLNIGVGMKLVKEEAFPPTRIYKVVSVTTQLNSTKILDLCGQKFAPEFGMNSSKFIAELAKIPGCVYLSKKDTGGNGRLVNVYFPNDRLRIGFDQEEMVSATIYAPNNEVQ